MPTCSPAPCRWLWAHHYSIPGRDVCSHWRSRPPSRCAVLKPQNVRDLPELRRRERRMQNLATFTGRIFGREHLHVGVEPFSVQNMRLYGEAPIRFADDRKWYGAQMEARL